jgi:hypothetical protein
VVSPRAWIGPVFGIALHSKPVAKGRNKSKYYSALVRAHDMRALRIALKKKT